MKVNNMLLNSGQQKSKLHAALHGPWIQISTIELHSVKNQKKTVKSDEGINVFHIHNDLYILHTYGNTIMTCQCQALRN